MINKTFGKNIQICKTDKQFIMLYYDGFFFTDGYRALSLNKNCLFVFTPKQAQIVQILVDNLELGVKEVSHSAILWSILCDNSDKNPILKSYFKSGNKVHPAWGTLIKSTGGPGAYVYLDFECLISPIRIT